MKWLSVYILIYLGGMILFTYEHQFTESGTSAWDVAYYIWQSVSYGSVLSWATIYALGNKIVKKVVRWCLYLSLLKLAWEVVSINTGLDINNEKAEMVFLFVLVIITAILSFIDMKKVRLRENPYNK